MKKTICIFGATGGIGGAAVRYFLSKGWEVIAVVRSMEKLESIELQKLDGVRVCRCNIENADETRAFIAQLKHEGVHIDRAFLAAGVFLWDDGFPGEILPFEEVQKTVYSANYLTKENILNALSAEYNISQISLDIIGSHAADFIEGHPFRKGETIYADTMLKTRTLAHQLKAAGKWNGIFLWEPGLIDTPMARAAFTYERAPDIDWSKAKTPEVYIQEIFANVEP